MVSHEEYQAKVKVIVTPEPEKEGLFWLHLVGMCTFDRPAMELRDVPPLFIDAAGQFLNRCALYTINKDRPILAGESVEYGINVPVRVGVVWSPDPFYEPNTALRLVPAAPEIHCGCVGDQGHVH